MYSRVNYTAVGVFVLLFGVGLIWFAFWFAKYGTKEEFATYKLEMKESIAGLSKGSIVKLHGVDIGRVSEIRINPKNIENIELFLKIKRYVPIKEDMTANLKMLGVTGLLYVEIEGGSNGAKTLRATQSCVPIIKTSPSLISRATKRIDSLSEKIVLLVEQGQKIFSDKNLGKLERMMDNLDKFTSNGVIMEKKAISSLEGLDKTAEVLRTSTKSITKEFVASSDNISKQISILSGNFSEIKDKTNPLLTKLTKTIKNFNRVALRVERGLRRGDYNFKKIFEPILVDVDILSNQLNDVTKQLERSPSDILFKSRKSRRGPGE